MICVLPTVPDTARCLAAGGFLHVAQWDAGLQVLGLRFKGGRSVPADRCRFLREQLGDAFIAVELEDSADNVGDACRTAHLGRLADPTAVRDVDCSSHPAGPLTDDAA